MNIFRKLTRNAVQTKLFRRYDLLRYRCLLKTPVRLLAQSSRGLRLCIASTIIPQGKINVEDDLRKAVEEGEAAIIRLMDELRDLLLTVSEQYRACLTKQIELIKLTGDQASGALPEFRSLATELNIELNEYVVLLKTIREIAYNQTIISFAVDNQGLETILQKYNELETLMLHEFEENKKKELELLEVNIANIALS